MKWPNSTVPEIRKLQMGAGFGVCPFCLRLLRPKIGKQGRRPQVCWSATCRAELDAAHGRLRRAKLSRSTKPRSKTKADHDGKTQEVQRR